MITTNKTTRSIKAADITKNWVLIDANNVRLGKLSTKIASLLMGKHKVTRANNLDGGDNVIVINAQKIDINSTSIAMKRYFWHTGFPGGIKSKSIVELLLKKPDYVLNQAVWGMLPKNRMGKKILRNMHIFSGENHNMQAQNPTVIVVK
jgi:large subunit ribosomal protein L13